MLGSISTKNLIRLFLILAFTLPINALAEDYPYRSYSSSAQREFSDYMYEVKNRIQKNWNPPDYMLKGHALTVFKVLKNGEIRDIRIIESSNNTLYDESAIDAINKSAPFPKFPESSERNYITIKYSFDASLIKTEKVEEYLKKADRLYNIDNTEALHFMNLAIEEVRGDVGSYFLYAKRSKVKDALGDIKGAEADMDESVRLKTKNDKRRIYMSKLNAEMDPSPFAYFYLANAYDIAGDYKNALEAIDKAINMTPLNNQYKKYKEELMQKYN